MIAASLSVQSVTRRFGAMPAADAVSVAAASAEFLDLSGPGGCA